MAGKHIGAGEANSSLGPNYIPGSRVDRAYVEGRENGRRGALTYTHDGGDASDDFVDSGESFTVDGFINCVITKQSTGAYALVTDNDGTTVVANLSGGETWDDDDVGIISGGKVTDNPHPVTTSDEYRAYNSAIYTANLAAFKYETSD